MIQCYLFGKRSRASSFKMPYFWDYMNFMGRGHTENHRKLQDGLFQIASQTCNLLVQVNNTNNITFGNNSTNVSCNGVQTAPARPKVSRQASQDEEQFTVLLPTTSTSKSTGYRPSTTRSKPRLSTVLENGPFSHEADRDFLGQGYAFRDDDTAVKRWSNSNGWCRPSCIPVTIILLLIFLVVLFPLLDHALEKNNNNDLAQLVSLNETCSTSCRISLTESIPEGLIYPDITIPYPSTYHSWMTLISSAQTSIEIASFYWTLRKSDVWPHPSSQQGEDVFQALLKAGTKRGITLKIAQNAPTQEQPNLDTEYLVKRRAAEVRSLNFAQLIGSGVLHTKLWIIDRKHFYLGSANMDWRALTQVKEMGLVGYNCSCLAEDVAKIFDVYWELGEEGAKIPSTWPIEYNTKINLANPVNLTLNNDTFLTYLSSSPPPFSPEGRSNDIDAILHVINQAEKFIYIAVMDYFPLMIYTPKVKYWPLIDDALRKVALEHKVHVKLLISWWTHSRKSEDHFLKSLIDVSNSYPGVQIEVRRFIVPGTPDQQKIPFGRVNHNKYMVTDNTAYIGTSNWSGDYFTDTAGIGFVLHDPVINRNESETTLRSQLEAVFERDWNSNYSHSFNTSINDF